VQHESSSFKAVDGTNIHTEAWLPEGEAQTVVLISHGIGEHIGRYGHLAARLVAEGYAVYGLDHRGHGKSDGLRAYYENFDQPVNDLKQYLDQVKAAQPGKKIFLYGHSLGSLIALVFTLRFQNELAGLVISGTPLEVEAGQPGLLVALGGLLNRVIPQTALLPLPTAYLSHDPAVVKAYETDPLNYHGNVRVRIGQQIVEMSRMVKGRLSEITLPLFIIHGAEDKICPPAGGETLYRGARSQDKALKLYPGLHHEIHNETPAEQKIVLDDTAAWLNERA